MPLVQRTAQVNYSAHQMYALVNDIEAYPDFLEGCREAQVLKQEKNYTEGRLVLARGPISYDLTTRNRLTQDSKIEMSLLKGPLKSLRGVWHFIPLQGSQCRVQFELEYESLFSLFDFTLRSFWEDLASSLIQAFCDRAKQIYGG